jgi:hypothetical protein
MGEYSAVELFVGFWQTIAGIKGALYLIALILAFEAVLQFIYFVEHVGYSLRSWRGRRSEAKAKREWRNSQALLSTIDDQIRKQVTESALR